MRKKEYGMIDVTPLKEKVGASLEVSYEDTAESLGLEVEEVTFVKPLSIKIRLVNTGKSITATGKVRTSMELTCDRCAEPFVFNLDSSFEIDFCNKHPIEHVQELTPEDLRMAYFDGERVDLIEEVRQQIILNIPMKPICKEECKGLCPTCGKNLNKEKCNCKEGKDFRFAKLLDLLKEPKNG